MKDLLHVAVGGGDCLLWTAAALTRTQIWRVPVPPVMFGVRLFVVVVVLRRFAEELCKGRDVNGSCLLLVPFAARKALLDLLQQPAVPVRIFKRHNMKSIGYWSPEDAPSSQNLFIYILEHPSRQEAEKNWAAFQADPEWKKVKTESEANGPLVDHIDRYFMDPTSYSALK